MTLLYIPSVNFYCGWQKHFKARKPHICCTNYSISAVMGCFELAWEWSDPPEHVPEASHR